MVSFLAGMEAMAFLVAALMFARFWRKTSDLLFGWFAGAFFLFSRIRF